MQGQNVFRVQAQGQAVTAEQGDSQLKGQRASRGYAQCRAANAKLACMRLTMMSTRLASPLRVLFSPKAFTRVVIFFLGSGRLMARMAGL